MLTLTDTARGKLEEVIAQQTQHGSKVFGLRLMAQAGCCSGPRFGMALRTCFVLKALVACYIPQVSQPRVFPIWPRPSEL